MLLEGKKVVILVGPDYEDLELHYPRLRLVEEGARVTLAGLGEPEYRGKVGYPARCSVVAAGALADEHDALLIPGGGAPDHLRMHAGALALVKRMDLAQKPIGAVGRAPHVLISAGVVDGRIVTSQPSIKDDLANANAEWVDRAVVVDRNLVTARVPDDLGAFMRELIALVARA